MSPHSCDVILLPGLACDDETWAGVEPVLARRHRVRMSDVLFRAPTVPGMAERLLAECDDLPAGDAGSRRPLVLIGHSMGGMVAMHAARRAAPGRIAAMALLATSARPDTPELIRLREQACEIFAAGRTEELLRANVLFAFHPKNVDDTPLVDAYVAQVMRAGAAQLIAQNRAVMARDDLRPHLEAMRMPVLVLAGEADGLTPPAVCEEIANALPNARFEVMAGCGHMLTLERPAAVAARLDAWLDEVGRGLGSRE